MDQENKNLTSEEVELVSGGDDGPPAIEWRRCRTCHKNTHQQYQGTGDGYDSYGCRHYCLLWLCQECGNMNYWDYYSHEQL